MANQILMPALSPTMTEGTLAKWLINEGDVVRSGDVVAEIETDKATMELEAIDDGVLSKILVVEGSEGVPVNTPIAIIAAEEDDAAIIEMQVAETTDEKKISDQLARDETVSDNVTKEAKAENVSLNSSDSITVREALRDAMAEEMRQDESVFLMGEEVAEYEGAYKISQGLLEEFGENVSSILLLLSMVLQGLA